MIADQKFYDDNRSLRIISKEWYYIVFNRYGKDVHKYLSESSDTQLSVSTVCKIGIQLLEQLKTIHDMGYIHCDLKPDNIIVGSNKYDKDYLKNLGCVKLIDYGIS